MKRNHVYMIIPLMLMVLMGIFILGCKKSSSSSSNTPNNGVTMTDYDGNVYSTVTIGKQVWTAENLKVTHFRNGKAIPLVSDSIQWTTLATSGYCYYSNNTAQESIYGMLYNFYAVTDSNNIAPSGWHMPSDAEWTTLTNYLGSGPGGPLKATGTQYWNAPNTGATNSTGFSGLPGGDRSTNGLFHYLGVYGCFWCTTESSPTEAYEHILSYQSTNVTRMSYSKMLGLSVRLVKDTI